MKETELAKVVIRYLEEMGWDVYQEVQLHAQGPVADIVAIMDKRVWVVECKMTLSLSLMAQAEAWRGWSHWTSVAVPANKVGRFGRMSNARLFARKVLRGYGLGLLEVRDGRILDNKIGPKLRRKIFANSFLDSVNEQHKVFAEAGNSAGKRWSPWKETCERITRYVKRNDGAKLKDVIEAVEHHYCNDSSANGAMAKWIREDRVNGLELRKVGRCLKVFYRGDTELHP